MAIFHANILPLLSETMFLDMLRASTDDEYTTATTGISLYQGTQPTANYVNDNWPEHSWDSVDYLGFVKGNILKTSTSSYTLQYLVSTTSEKSGTCTWAILWSSGSVSSTSSIASGTIPTTNFWVVPASDITTSTGVVKLNNANLVAGQITTVTDISLVLGGL